jgi:uncharacterized protein YndB with AHSA1/START domain
MSGVHTRIKIAAPVEKVWDAIMDPDRWGDWVTIHRAVSDVSERPLTKGSTMTQVLHMRGVSFRVHWRLIDVSEPNHAEWEGRGPAHSKARIRYELAPDSDGATEFEYINDFAPPGGRLGTVAGRLVVGAAAEREAQKSLQRLKALLERN